jgi:O-antigen/teichoic acid export membrane protein
MGSAVIIARVLGPEKQGLFALALLIPMTLSSFCCFGFENVNTTFAGLYKNNRDSMFLHSLCVSIMGSVISILVICAYFFWLPVNKGEFGRLSTLTVWLACLFASTTILWTMMVSLLRGVGEIVTAAFLQIVQGFLLLVLTAIFVWFVKGGVEGAVLAFSLGSLMPSAIVIWYLREYATIRPSRFSKELFVKSLSFGWMTALASVASFLFYRFDQGMLAYMVSASYVGLYALAVSLAERLRLLPMSVAAAFLPRLANDFEYRQKQTPQMFRCMLIVSFGTMLLLGAAGVPAIYLFFGKAYVGSIPSFLVLLPGVAILGGSGILSSDLLARGKPKYAIIFSYTMLAINILMNLLLIPRIGILGAAISSSITYSLGCFMALKFYQRESGTPFREMIVKWSDFLFLRDKIINYSINKFKR